MEQRFVLLTSRKWLFKEPLPPGVSVCRDRSQVEAVVTGPRRRVTWISFTRNFTDILLKEAVDARADLRGSHLITLAPPRAESVPALVGLFQPVFGLGEAFQWLPKEEFVEVLTLNDASERFIGGCIDRKAKVLTLLRGDIETVLVPFAIFQRSGDGTEPDFARLRLADYGRTVAFGEYEASADAILYELDADYRRKLRKRRRESERTLGAALMRLRKQRRFKRSDFAPISAKEIARIERNEIRKPHATTLDVIANRLGVRPEEIADY
jgi:hypothetical protein